MTTEFEQAQQGGTPAAPSEFQQAQNETPKPLEGEYINQLRQSGFNFESPEDIAKKAINADQHITNLQTELKELRAELDKRLTVEENLERANQQRQEEQAANTTPSVTQEDIAELVKKGYTDLTDAQKAEANLMEANAKLIEKYGEGKGAEVLVAKSKELNITVDAMIQTAQQSPQAFYNLIGIDTTKQVETTGVATGSVNSDALAHTTVNNQAGKPGTFEYFEELRRTDKRKYFSAETQKAIHKAHADGTYVIPRD